MEFNCHFRRTPINKINLAIDWGPYIGNLGSYAKINALEGIWYERDDKVHWGIPSISMDRIQSFTLATMYISPVGVSKSYNGVSLNPYKMTNKLLGLNLTPKTSLEPLMLLTYYND